MKLEHHFLVERELMTPLELQLDARLRERGYRLEHRGPNGQLSLIAVGLWLENRRWVFPRGNAPDVPERHRGPYTIFRLRGGEQVYTWAELKTDRDWLR